MSTYRPIPCQIYAELELAIMHRVWLRLAWTSPAGSTRLEQVLPVDLLTRAGEEFLLARTRHDQPLEIRLDRIRGFAPL